MEIASKNENRMRIVSVKEPRIDAAVAIEFKDAMRVQTDGAIAFIGVVEAIALHAFLHHPLGLFSYELMKQT